MSRMDKAEIQQELEHLNRLLAIAHDNRRALEEQQIQQGIIAPLSLINQMNEIKRSIQEYEERKNQLEIQAVEEDDSLAEAEYRVIAARAWEQGQLSALGGAELQLSRLTLKIPKERADQIEQEIRTELTRSMFSAVSLEIIWQRLDSKNRDQFKLFYTLIKLNHREFFDMAIKSFEIVKAAPDALFENYSMRGELSEEILRSLERNIIIAANIVFASDLEFLHQAIEYFTAQLESKGLLASQ
jgi:hypothetical protein